MVDATRSPIDFKALDERHVDQCAQQRRCGVCGERIRPGKDRYAFLGPLRELQCFGDPWMHVECADYTAGACPFVSGKRRVWREGSQPILEPFSGAWMLLIARSGKVHRDAGAWHFQPVDLKRWAVLE